MENIIETLKRFKIQILVLLIIAVSVPLTIIQLSRQQETRSRAATGVPVSLNLKPLTSTTQLNTQFDVELRINTSTNNVTAVDTTINYDSSILTLVSFTPASTFTTVTNNSGTAGTLHYVGVNIGDAIITGPDLSIGTFKFNGTKIGTAGVTYSNIQATAQGVTGLLPVDTTNTKSGSYTITNTILTPTPTLVVGIKAPPCFMPTSILDQLGLPTNTNVKGYGDVDLDGDVDSNDSLLILRIVAQIPPVPEPRQIEAGDVDSTWNVLSSSLSTITAVDSLMIQRYLADLPIPSQYNPPNSNTISLPVCLGQPTPTLTPTVTLTPTPTPTAAPIPDCNGGGSCTACLSDQSNTCNGNGKQTCTYTLYNGDARCNTVSSQVTCNTAPPNCSSGYTCSANKVCVADPTPTLSPTPTPTTAPTATPTQIPGVTPTLTPIVSPTTVPTPSPIPGGTQIALNIGLDSIGSVGDSTNPDPSASTKNPKRPIRNVTVELYNSSETLVSKFSGTVQYDSTSGRFMGTVGLGQTAGGNYIVKVKSLGYLKKRIPGITSLVLGQTYKATAIDHIPAGDVNGDNHMDIADYNILNDCIFAPAATNGAVCSQNPDYAIISDLNDDGIKNILDYSLFLRELIVRDGD